MENQDQTTKKDNNQPQPTAPITIQYTPNVDDEDCIVLNADVYDELELEIEDAQVSQVVIDVNEVIDKKSMEQDIEDAIVVDGVAQVQATEIVEAAEAIQPIKTVEVIEVAEVVEIAETAKKVEVLTSESEVTKVVESVEVIHTEVVSIVENNMTAPDVVNEQNSLPSDLIAIHSPHHKEYSRTIVNVGVVDTNVVEANTTDLVGHETDEVVRVETDSIDIDMTDEVNINVGVIHVDIDMDDEVNDDKDSHVRVGYLHTHQPEPTVEKSTPQNSYPSVPPADSTQTLDVSSDSIHKKATLFPKNFTKPALFLAGSSILGIWVMQQSINAYFVQTYHKPSPLANIDNGVWQAGAKVHDGLIRAKEGATPPATTPTTPPAPLTPPAQETALPIHNVMTPKQAKEEIIKASLTLNSNQKVFFAGDSLMQGVAPHIQKHLQQLGVQSVNLSKQSTGLAYPKFFDWPTTIKDTITKDKDIKVLVILLGPNDPWDMPVKGGGQYLKFKSPEWDSEYQSRMADILNFAKAHHVGVIWVTPPNMKKEKLDTQMMHINTVMMAELSRHNVQVIDSRPVLGSIENHYHDYVEQDGQKIKVRSGDGIHFTPNGQRILAQHIQSYLTIVPQ